MAECIERAAAIDAVSEVYYDTPDVNLSAEKFEAAINAIPAADVVPVVRCKDCDGGQVSDDGEYVICCRLGISTAFWDFCSYGERKGDKHEH